MQGYDLTYVFRLDSNSKKWVWNDYDWTVISICIWNDYRCVLSREGNVNLYGPGGSPDRTYQIPDAGEGARARLITATSTASAPLVMACTCADNRDRSTGLPLASLMSWITHDFADHSRP